MKKSGEGVWCRLECIRIFLLCSSSEKNFLLSLFRVPSGLVSLESSHYKLPVGVFESGQWMGWNYMHREMKERQSVFDTVIYLNEEVELN